MAQSLFSLLAIIVITILLVLSVYQRRGTGTFCVLFLYYIFYDYLFITAGYVLSPFVITSLKLIFEVILLYLLYRAVTYGTTSNRIPIRFVIIPFVYASVISLIGGFSINGYLRGFRLFFEPLFACYLFSCTGYFKSIDVNVVNRLLTLVIVPLVIFSFYQYRHYLSVSDLWFYKAFSINADLDEYPFLYFREGRVRAPSFFDGPINASLFYSYVFCFFYCQKTSLFKKVSRLILPSIGIYLSNTRIGIVVIALFIVLYFFKNWRLRFLCTIPLLAIAFTILSLVFGYYEEASALGRIVQYANFFSDFNIVGLGLANEEALVKYDSFFISLFLAMGFVSFLFYYFFYLFARRVHYCIAKGQRLDPITICTYLLTVLSIYIIAFQYYAGYASYKIYILFLFLSYNQINRVLYGRQINPS